MTDTGGMGYSVWLELKGLNIFAWEQHARD